MNRPIQLAAFAALLALSQGVNDTSAQALPPVMPPGQAPRRVSVLSQTAGPTVFISNLLLDTPSFSTLKSVQFEIVPKPGSVTRPFSAVYYADYLESRGYVDKNFVQTTVPVFGLYSAYANTVNLTYRYTDGTSETETITITTAAFDDPHGYNTPTVLQARTKSTDLSYDYFQVKSAYSPNSPILMDTDGEVRWVGTTGIGYVSQIFYDNSFFVPDYPPNGTALTALDRLEFDGTFTQLQDYTPLGATLISHHSYDKGREGILVEVTTTQEAESTVYEVDVDGNVLRVYSLSDIIRNAMIAGGDDPSGFVYPAPTDWFHNNACAYRASDNTLIVSSRENFVIGIDYDTSAIKWILGDPTKHWHDYPSLVKYALALTPGSLPPIGQHAVSITHDDDLLLFDNGEQSAVQMPIGAERSYSAARKYSIDLKAMTATEVWTYADNEAIFNRFTGSVYEDDALNYLIDFSDVTIGGKPTYAEFIGLSASGEKVFDYQYPISMIGVFAWNIAPIHLENLVFTGPQTAPQAGHPAFFTGEQALTNGVYYLSFPANGTVFGYYAYLSDPHYIYHFGLGYEYVFDAGDSERGVYLYDFASKSFLYTSPQFPFPYFYDFGVGSVVYYLAGQNAPDGTRYFYNFTTKQFFTQ